MRIPSSGLASALLYLCATVGSTQAFPDLAARASDSHGGKIIRAPPKQQDTGSKVIPDHKHPYRAPGPNDQRGPCPGLNTLANHGYLPRNGIATYEEIIQAVGEGFNMEYGLASALAAFGIVSRGNAYTNQLSIGAPSPLVPPLPGNIDGNVTKGLATHGRFEGDVSMTRKDAAVGDNVHFNQDLFNVLLDKVAQFGNDSDVTGPKSIVSLKSMQEFKIQRFRDDQKENPELEYHAGRLLLSYGESSFTLNFFANGTDGTLSIPTMTSFFKNQTFPSNNWHRRPSPADGNVIGETAGQIQAPYPVPPGANAPNGTYVPDTDIPDCALYLNLGVDNVPGVLVNTTGTLKKNVDFLLDRIHDFFPDCEKTLPRGPAGV